MVQLKILEYALTDLLDDFLSIDWIDVVRHPQKTEIGKLVNGQTRLTKVPDRKICHLFKKVIRHQGRMCSRHSLRFLRLDFPRRVGVDR